MTDALYDEDDFQVEVVDEMGICVRSSWGARSYVSSWHLVDEKKAQLNRMTRPEGWDLVSKMMKDNGRSFWD